MTTDLVDPLVDVTLRGTPAEIAAGLTAAAALLRNADVVARGALNEGYHAFRADQSEMVAIPARIEARSVIRPLEGEPVLTASWVPSTAIESRHVAFVRGHVLRAASQLGIDGEAIPIRWFGPAVGEPDFWTPMPPDGSTLTGISPDDEMGGIAFNVGLRGDALVGIVAHEVRHVWQAQTRERLADRTYCEGDADDFAADYLATVDHR